MKIYAKFIEDEGLLYRTNTLIQFGKSWELIGSIVMKNPGSSKPENSINKEDQIKISEFYNKEIDSKNWYSSSVDKTIQKVALLFNGNFIDEHVELNGIIQIFNILNIVESNIERAINLANNSKSKYLLPNIDETINSFRNKPVYLGFFDFYTDKTSVHQKSMEDFARRIFNYVKNSEHMYLPFEDIIDNPMYHPFSPQIQSKRSLPILKEFFNLYSK